MQEEILIGIVSVIVLGIGTQWLAWRVRVPSILLLLVVGFVAGPVTGLLPPESLKGDWLFAFVSLSIGIILFEGGLSLRISELREVGKAVLNLITIGVLVTWALAGVAAYYVAGFNLGLSVQIGAILTVTGPTVVIPLLRHVRPTGRVGAIAKWEGITIDPVGAILAVLVLETILVLNQTTSAVGDVSGFAEAALHAMEGLLLTIFISVGTSIAGAALLVVVLRRRLVPDYLLNPVALMVVVAAFALSNLLQAESGLLTATLLGIFLANQPYASVRRIVEFKENLQVLLIACLFILLSARLELDALDYIDTRALLFLAVLILLVRPIAVVISSAGTKLTWKEQAFMAWLAPRGIVAAAIASLFAFSLQDIYGEEADRLIPVVFLVIVGTVAVYGLTISPLARYLGLAQPNPQGVLFLGAHPWAQRIARTLHDLGFKVLIIDSNAKNIEQAQRNGVPARRANALSEAVVDELDLGGIGRFLALTPNDEVNSLAVLNFSEIFESREVYQLAARPESLSDGEGELPRHLRGRPLFDERANYLSLTSRFNEGGEVKTFDLTEDFTYEKLQRHYDREAIPLFLCRGQDELLVFSEEDELVTQPGDTLVVFMPPIPRELEPRDQASFEQLVERALFVELSEATSFEDIVRQASALFAHRLPIAADRLAKGFLEGSRYGATPVSHGVALPHYRLAYITQPEMVMVRCQSGVSIAFDDLRFEDEPLPQGDTEPVYAMLFLVSPEQNPGQHLRILAHIANRIDDVAFMEAWRSAADEQQLKEIFLHRER